MQGSNICGLAEAREKIKHKMKVGMKYKRGVNIDFEPKTLFKDREMRGLLLLLG